MQVGLTEWARRGRVVLIGLSLWCGAACGSSAEPVGDQGGAIVGGQEADDRSYAWMAAVMYDYEGTFYQGCGGSFIDERHVVTAGHCSVDFLYEPENHAYRIVPIDPATVRIARRPQSLAALTAADLLEVTRVWVHPNYDDHSLDSDVAVWELAQPVRLRHYPEFAEREEIARWTRQGRTVRTIGYGTIDPLTGETSDTLLEVDVPLLSDAECRAAYEGTDLPITDTMICAGLEQGGKDSCWGDSGGPLFKPGREPTLLAVVSTGIGCAEPGHPGVYTQLSGFRSWIRQCRRGNCPTLTRPQIACELGYDDCDHAPANGCEAYILGTDACGACGAPACAAGEVCGLDLASFELGCEAAAAIQPELLCVGADATGAPAAQFTAFNASNRLQVLPVGPNNHFAGSSSTPTVFFFPGDPNPTSAALDLPGPASWTLNGVTAAVATDAPACPSAEGAAVDAPRRLPRVLQHRWTHTR